RVRAAIGVRKLRPHARLDPLAREVARDREALVDRVPRRGDDPEALDHAGALRLDAHRRLEHDLAVEAGRPPLGDLAEHLLEDQRMNDRVQLSAALGIAEDDRAEPLPVDRPVGRDDAVAERLDQPSPSLAAVLVHAMADLVGVDDVRAELLEHAADEALPRSDAAGEADDHGACRTGWRA